MSLWCRSGIPPAFIGIGGFSLEEVLTLHAHALPRNAQHPPDMTLLSGGVWGHVEAGIFSKGLKACQGTFLGFSLIFIRFSAILSASTQKRSNTEPQGVKLRIFDTNR